MKKFLVTLALLSMTTLVLGGCLEKLTGEEAAPAEEATTEEATPAVEPVPAPATPEAPAVEEAPVAPAVVQ